ncbi:MAG: CRTAC1 family protein [Planctomycetota bacterium]
MAHRSPLMGVLLCWMVPMSSAALAGTGPVPFTEEAVARGIDYVVPQWTSIERFGCGVAFADLDGDRDPDLVVTGQASDVVGVYENDGTGHFADRSAGSGIPVMTHRSGVVAFDYDGDRDLDLYFTRMANPNVLMRNDGGFAFTDVTADAGVEHTGGTGVAVADYDLDGWLDLYVPNYGGRDALFHNRADGTFRDVAVETGMADPWRGWQAVFFDMDGDADPDLYVSNDKKVATETVMHNRLYQNNGGTFVDISPWSGTDVNIYSMGIGIGDMNADGLQDIYCTNMALEPNAYFLNQGAGFFVPFETPAGLESNRTGWAAIFFDYDNDRSQDLYVCNMGGPPPWAGPANRLYVHGGGWPCTDIASGLGVDDMADSFAAAVADIEGDGDLDLVVQNNEDRIRLYVNHEGETRHWLRLDVRGQGANAFAVGARVRVRTVGGWQDREIIAGGNTFKSQNELVASFGLGDAATADEIQVIWPGGATRTVTGVAGDRMWRVMPPERVGDVDDNGVIDVSDLLEILGIWGPCDACPADGNLDGVVDVTDLLDALANWS